jgi:hypothetical protein
MACWPANVMGAFMLALILFDVIRGELDDIPYHFLLLLIFVGILWLLCTFLGEGISAGVLLVPAVVLAIGLFTLWFTNQSLRKQGCCIQCRDPKLQKVLVKKSTGEVVTTLPSQPTTSNETGSVTVDTITATESSPKTLTGTLTDSKSATCEPNLKATTII